MAKNLLTIAIAVGATLYLYTPTASAETGSGPTLIRGTIVQPTPGPSAVSIVLRGEGVKSQVEAPTRNTRLRIPAPRVFAGDKLWFVDRGKSSISACWVAGTGRVGVSRVRCASAVIRN
jgi:hypothetical protein